MYVGSVGRGSCCVLKADWLIGSVTMVTTTEIVSYKSAKQLPQTQNDGDVESLHGFLKLLGHL